MILPLLSAFAFGFGAIASKRSEDGGERAGVRAEVIPDVKAATEDFFFKSCHPSKTSKNQLMPR